MRRISEYMRPWIAAGLACAVALMFAGCAAVYDVKVDAIQNRTREAGHSYRIVSKDPARPQSDPNYAKAEKLVRNALSGRGMYEAEDPAEAEVVVEIDYSVGPAREKIEGTDPAMAIDPLYDVRLSGRIPRDSLGRPVVITSDPRGRIVVRDVYEKRLTIVAREGEAAADKTSERPEELWRVEVKIEDEKPKVDDVLPVLVGAAVDHIGTDSTSQKTKRLSEDSEPVDFVKGGS